jgi:hypothetical protein
MLRLIHKKRQVASLPDLKRFMKLGLTKKEALSIIRRGQEGIVFKGNRNFSPAWKFRKEDKV